jgi:hypothetical protein
MAAITLVVPILAGKAEAHARFCQAILTTRRDEHTRSRRNLGIVRERAWAQHLPDGSTGILMRVEGPGATDFQQAQVRSADPYDHWFLEQAREINGDSYYDEPKAPEPGYDITTNAPDQHREISYLVPVPEDCVDAWWEWTRDLEGMQRMELLMSRERARIHRETVWMVQLPNLKAAAYYMQGASALDELQKLFLSHDPFDRAFSTRAREIYRVDVTEEASLMPPTLRFAWDADSPPVQQRMPAY